MILCLLEPYIMDIESKIEHYILFTDHIVPRTCPLTEVHPY